MGKRLFANSAKGKLNAGIAAAATAFTLQGGQGALFPTTATGKTFSVTAIDSAGAKEVIKVTTHAAGSDTFAVVVRGQEGTTPLDLLAGDKIELRLTAAALAEFDVKPVLQTIAGDTALDYDDFFNRLIITASANLTLPDSGDVEVGAYIDFKSLTTGHVRFTPTGADTIDGVNALWRVPSYTTGKIMKIAAGQWALVEKPDVEIGDLEFWPVNSGTPKLGYEFADNNLLSRATYAGLFAVYGVTHGAGDGTNFGKPDMRDRVPIGRGDMGGAAAGLITSGGNDTDTGNLNTATIGAKGGSQSSQRHTHVQDPHTHTVPSGASVTSSIDYSTNGVAFNNPQVTGATTATNQNAFTGQSGNIQPGLVGNWLVKT